MRNRLVRNALLLVALAAIAGSAFLFLRIEQMAASRRSAIDDFDRTSGEVLLHVADLRAGAQAYVAAGQAMAAWSIRVTQALDTVTGDLTSRRAAAGSEPARTALDEAGKALATFTTIDRRAREYAQAGDLLMASDLVFSDAVDALATVSSQVDLARIHEREAAQGAIARYERQAQVTLLGCAGGLLIIMLLLAPLPGSQKDAAGDPEAAQAGDLELGRLEMRTPAIAAGLGSLALAPPPAPLTPVADLNAVAGLCADFARVNDSGQLPSLVARMSEVLGARGIIVWIGSGEGKQLRPALFHGYPSQVIDRLGSIGREDDNVTAAAYRAGEVLTAEADGTGLGAVAVPLLTPDGCVGVVAAEFAGGREHDRSVQSMAAILAAQLATMVSGAVSGAPGSRARAH